MLRPFRVLALQLLCVAAALASGAPANAESFPMPAAIVPRVDFWTRVYSEVGTNGGFIHDNKDLSRVYETVRVPAGSSDGTLEREIDRAKARVVSALRTLAAGKRTGLGKTESRVLAQFPPGVSNRTLARGRGARALPARAGGQVQGGPRAHGPLGAARAPRDARARRARGPEGAPARRVVVQPGRALARGRRPAYGSSCARPRGSSCASTTSWTSGAIPSSPRRPRRASCAATTSASGPGRSASPRTTTAPAGSRARSATSARGTSASSSRATRARRSASRRRTSTPSSSPRAASTRTPRSTSARSARRHRSTTSRSCCASRTARARSRAPSRSRRPSSATGTPPS